MDELAVVRQQQQARGVVIEPAHGLHFALAQRYRQQVVDALVVARPLRALIAGGLVEHQVGLGAGQPRLAVHGELQAIHLEACAGVFA
ncbi:hypothetical protein D3C81_1572900 [compost metagenome]